MYGIILLLILIRAIDFEVTSTEDIKTKFVIRYDEVLCPNRKGDSEQKIHVARAAKEHR